MTNLIGLAELAELYGVSKNTANTWARRHGFPAPVATLKMGPVWDRDEVVAWKTPASQQHFQVRCGYCYSDAVYNPGVNLDCSFTVECGNCGRRSRFAITQIPGPVESGWPTVVITVAKEDE